MKVAVWIRLIVLIGFGILVGIQEMWLLLAIAVLALIATGYQLYTLYKH